MNEDAYIFFWGQKDEHGYMSNFYRATYAMGTTKYSSSEQGFMVAKAKMFNDLETELLMLETENPAAIKRLGKKVKGYRDDMWAVVRKQVMYMHVFNKFNQNPDLRKKLLDTIPAILVEASPVDNIWGIGMAVDNPALVKIENWGQNLLGEILMEVREDLWRIDNDAKKLTSK